jgi:hypothetical protein
MRGWILPLLIILIVFGVGLWLWCPSNRAPDRYSDLGTTIIGGGVIVFGGLFLERRLSRAAERRDLQLQLGLQNNLVGIDLNRRDLSGFYLSGKDLRYANLTKANLRRANLSGVDLRHATLDFADLRGTKLDKTSLKPSKGLKPDKGLKPVIYEDVKESDTSFFRAK